MSPITSHLPCLVLVVLAPLGGAENNALLSGKAGGSESVTAGPNLDVSKECGLQGETLIALNQSHPRSVADGSNEIFRLPVRGSFSADGLPQRLGYGRGIHGKCLLDHPCGRQRAVLYR
jgi:hypothetical protein